MRILGLICFFVAVGYMACDSGSSGRSEKPASDAGRQDVRSTDSMLRDRSSVASDADSTSDTKTPSPDSKQASRYTITIDKRGHAASLLMSTNEFKKWSTRQGFQNKDARQKLTQEVYKVFKDDFDFIFYIMNTTQRPKEIPFGQLYQVRNSVKGLGMSIFDRSASYGSSGKLQAVMQFGRRDYLLSGPSLHELLHNWANFALDTKLLISDDKEANARPHWGISDVGGQLGGFDPSTFKQNVDGDKTKYQANMPGRKNFGFNSNGGNGVPYANLELYMMGLISKDKVRPIRVFTGLRAVRNEFIAGGKFFAKEMKVWTIDDIIKKHGLRTPTPQNAQKSFRVLALILTDKPLSASEWDALDAQVVRFSKKGDDGSRTYNFWEATGGRASLKMDALHQSKR